MNSYSGVNISITIQQLSLGRLPILDCLFHLIQLGYAIPEYACPVDLSWLVSNEKVQCLIRRTAPRSTYWRHNCTHITAFYRYALCGLQRGEFTALLRHAAC